MAEAVEKIKLVSIICLNVLKALTISEPQASS